VDRGVEVTEFALLPAARVPELLPLAHEFEAAIGSPFIVVDDAVFVDTWRRFIDAGVGFVLVALDPAPVGVLAGYVVPDDLSGRVVAQERWWYVTPAYRRGGVGRALAELFERHAREKGAYRVSLGNIGHLPAVDGLMRDLGYSPLETHWFRLL